MPINKQITRHLFSGNSQQLRAISNTTTLPAQFFFAAWRYLPLLLEITKQQTTKKEKITICFIFSTPADQNHAQWFWHLAFLQHEKLQQENNALTAEKTEKSIHYKVAFSSLHQYAAKLNRKSKEKLGTFHIASTYKKTLLNANAHSTINQFLIATKAAHKKTTPKEVQTFKFTSAPLPPHKFTKQEKQCMEDLAAKTEMGFLLLFAQLQSGATALQLASTVKHCINTQLNMQGLLAATNANVLITPCRFNSTHNTSNRPAFSLPSKKEIPENISLLEKLTPESQINIEANSHANKLFYARSRSIYYGKEIPKQLAPRFLSLQKDFLMRLGIPNKTIHKKPIHIIPSNATKKNALLNTTLKKLLAVNKQYQTFVNPVFPLETTLTNNFTKRGKNLTTANTTFLQQHWQYGPNWLQSFLQHQESCASKNIAGIGEVYLNFLLFEKNLKNTAPKNKFPKSTNMSLQQGCCLLLQSEWLPKKISAKETSANIQKIKKIIKQQNTFIQQIQLTLVGKPAFNMLHFNNTLL